MSGTIPATYAAIALGMTGAALAAYARRNPDLLPRVGRGPHGVALYRVTDVRRLGESRIARRTTTV